MKRTPTLDFAYDDTAERADRLGRIIDQPGARADGGHRGLRHGRRPASGARRAAHVDRFVLVTHEHPDGDALGSLVAMHGVLRALGKDS